MKWSLVVLSFFFVLRASAGDSLRFNGKPLVVDLTSLRNSDLRTSQICQKTYEPDGKNSQGIPLKVLGMAVTYMAPGFATSPAGHIGIRFVYCYGDSLNDRLVEVTQFMERELPGFREEYPELQDKDWHALEHGLYLKASVNPAALEASHGEYSGYGTYQVANNRNIYESWLDFSGSDRLSIMREIFDLLSAQKQRLNSDFSLPKYDQFKVNCVTVVEKILAKYLNTEEQKRLGHAITPKTFFKRIDALRGSGQIILYPSQRSLRMLWNRADHESNKGEKWLPFAKTTDSRFNDHLEIYYPYGIAGDPKLPESIFAATVNLPAAAAETVVGLVEAPVKGLQAAKLGGVKMLFSAAQLLGWTLLHPASTPWTEEEKARLKNESAAQTEPAVLAILQTALN